MEINDQELTKKTYTGVIGDDMLHEWNLNLPHLINLKKYKPNTITPGVCRRVKKRLFF